MAKVHFVNSGEEIPKNGIVGFDIETFPRKDIPANSSLRADPRLSEIALCQVESGGDGYVLTRNFHTLRGLLEDARILKVMHTGSFEYKNLFHHYGIRIRNLADIAILEGIIKCGIGGRGRSRTSLETLSREYLGIKLDKSVREKFIRGARLDQEMISYGVKDALVCVPIYRKQMQSGYDGFEKVARLEFSLVPAVAEIELEGIGFDQEAWEQLADKSERKLNQVLESLSRTHGGDVRRLGIDGSLSSKVNFNSPDQKSRVLESAGIDLPNTQYRTLLEYYRKTGNHLVKSLLILSKLQKRTSTYGREFLTHVNPVTKRIHQSIFQVEARTGRLAGRNPNLMNMIASSPYRSCFVARPRYKFISADFSAQEYRILAEQCQEPAMLEAFERGEDIHVTVARMLFKDSSIDKSHPRRGQGKNMNFGIIYGMGERRLAKELGCSETEASDLLKEYFSLFPRVKNWTESWREFARVHGYVTTMIGRRRYLEIGDGLGYEREATNTPIQGTAAEMTKLAVLKLRKRLQPLGGHIVNVVHDEIDSEVPDEAADEAVSQIRSGMIEAAGSLVKVPFEIDVKVSDRWDK